MNEPPLYLSRARLRRDAPAAALRALLIPADDSARVGAGHRLVWTLFADSAQRERDFLWREADGGVFYLLSRRPPRDPHGLFDLDDPKPFAPSLAAGDRLGFSLRANATVARGGGPGRRGKPSDVVMNALYEVPSGGRAAERQRVVQSAGRRWLEAQGARCGFALTGNDRAEDSVVDEGETPGVRIVAYRTLRIEHHGPAARIGVLDFEGELEVRDPEKFTTALGQGFGRAKAFGCGLMLVRRARIPRADGR